MLEGRQLHWRLSFATNQLLKFVHVISFLVLLLWTSFCTLNKDSQRLYQENEKQNRVTCPRVTNRT